MHASSARTSTRLTRLARTSAIAVIRGYQLLIRPLLIGSCKYCPTCSDYAIEAIAVHGLFRGGLLTLRRVVRCHPFGPGGIDPVPPGRSGGPP